MSPHFKVLFDSVHRKPWPRRSKRLGLHHIASNSGPQFGHVFFGWSRFSLTDFFGQAQKIERQEIELVGTEAPKLLGSMRHGGKTEQASCICLRIAL